MNKYLETIFIKATGDKVHIKDQMNFDNKCQNSGEQKRHKNKKEKKEKKTNLNLWKEYKRLKIKNFKAQHNIVLYFCLGYN